MPRGKRPCRNGVPGCKGDLCLACGRDKQERRAARPQRPSRWTPRASDPPETGVVEGTDHIVSFKTGGPSGEETLIADGDLHEENGRFAGKPGRRGHNHYGPTGSQDRGKYTGPDH